MYAPARSRLSYDDGSMVDEWTVDTQRRLVTIRVSGGITYAEVMAARRAFTNHSGFHPDFFQLIDLREVTQIGLSGEEIRKLAVIAVFSPSSRRAIVTPRDEAFGLARMFAIYREINNGREQIEVFRSIEEAEAWLNKA